MLPGLRVIEWHQTVEVRHRADALPVRAQKIGRGENLELRPARADERAVKPSVLQSSANGQPRLALAEFHGRQLAVRRKVC